MRWTLSRSRTTALLLSPAGIFLVSITRLLVVSNYNVPTALTVASSGGYINTLLGTFIPIVPLLMPYLALILLFLNRIVLGILAFFATVLTAPAIIGRPKALSVLSGDGRLVSHSPITEAVLFLFFVALALGVATLPADQASKTVSTIAGFILVPFVLTLYPLPLSGGFYGRQLQQPWLPAETLILVTHQNVVGYVLSRDQDWFVVLLARSRTIFYIRTSQVAGQIVCQLKSTKEGRPLVSLISEPATVPTCPALASSVP